MPSPLAATLRQAIATLEQGLIERSAAVRLCLLAALAGEHVLLIGPPGTAKSELARRLHRVVGGERYFERLLTRFSTPEELFGPLSLKALEDDRYERLIDGYLPTAGVGFLDEVFKANSAILNALLTLLNERQFDNGQHRLKVPLISLVGASNEVPADESLQAFHDRFLLRVPVLPVSDAGFEPLLALGTEPPAAAAALTRADIDAVAAQREGVSLPADVRAHLKALRGFTAAQGVTVSDRRWRQLAGLLRTAALGEGRDRVDALDLWLLPYAVAAEPAQVPVLAHWFLADVVQALPQDAPWLTRAVEAFEAQLRIESAAQAEEGDDSAGKLALARRIGGALDSVPMPRLMSATLQAQRHKHYGTLHIAARVAQVDEVLQRAAAHLAEVRARAETTAAALQDRVWLPPELAHRIRHGQAHTLAVLQALQQRLLELRAGFAALPVDGQAAGAPPAAVVLPDEPALAPDA